MNCPRCGAAQPYDMKCVKCDTDIAGFLKSEKQRLRFYQIAAVVFFGMTLWLGVVDLFVGKTRSFPNIPERTAEVAGEENPSGATPLPVFVPPQSQSAAAGVPVAVVLNKAQLAPYETFVAFRTQYRDAVTVFDMTKDLPVEADLNGATVVAIGQDAVTAVSAKRYDLPQVYLSRQENLASLFNPGDKIVGISTSLSPDMELTLLHQLLPESRSFIFVAADATKRPSFGLVKDFDLRVAAANADAVSVERELLAAGDTQPVLWLYGLTTAERERVLAAVGLDKTLIVQGFAPGETKSASKTSEEETTPVFLQMGLSNEGLGKQGALLTKRLAFQADVPEADYYPKGALEVRLHVQRALALEREDLVQTLHDRARRAGYQVRLTP